MTITQCYGDACAEKEEREKQEHSVLQDEMVIKTGRWATGAAGGVLRYVQLWEGKYWQGPTI